MSKNLKIPVHRMDDWFSGIYLKPFGIDHSAGQGYKVSEPHRHDFYYCVLVDKGSMEMEVDFKKVRLIDQTLFLSYPGQIHQINSARVEHGWFLAFDPSMLDEQLKNILDQCLSEIILTPLSPEQSAGLCIFMDNLFAIYNDPQHMFRQAITQSMVTALIYQLASIYLSMERFNLIRHSARSIEITKAFKQALRNNLKTIRRPSEFAEKMNMTTSYLNDTVKAVTGFSVSYYIQQEMMREGQRLLHYSSLSVKEIGNALGFEDEKYFNRLFKKVIGISPGAFRKKATN
ncbi:helix-turn-helix transcriptional regulator [Pedobacter aquatilis]|uniref:AraC family transcriptional regulator n=1 Tax=Pedobacter aquatilis TaxID=351343 RepID=UPI00292D918A|nr:helix-turn-helix transcriptional regulator [Pedobacter aquatilis]